MRNIFDNYKKTFEAWNKERTALSVYCAKTDETYTYTPAENEEFRQCHLEDTCENRKQKFLKLDMNFLRDGGFLIGEQSLELKAARKKGIM